jgi:hypothetical protein
MGCHPWLPYRKYSILCMQWRCKEKITSCLHSTAKHCFFALDKNCRMNWFDRKIWKMLDPVFLTAAFRIDISILLIKYADNEKRFSFILWWKSNAVFSLVCRVTYFVALFNYLLIWIITWERAHENDSSESFIWESNRGLMMC